LGSSSTQNTTASDPTGGFSGNSGNPQYAPTSTGAMGAAQCGITGGNQPHPNIQPFTCVTFIIALVGIFPSRN
jgi:microcystin-dependent protein